MPVDGTASFIFDTSTFSSNFQDNIPLTTLEIAPSTFGGTLFDTSNSQALVVFADNELTTLRSISIGGVPTGPGGMSTGTDDWLASLNFETNSQRVQSYLEQVASKSLAVSNGDGHSHT